MDNCTVCVNQAHNSPIPLRQRSCMQYAVDLHGATQVVSRLHATVLAKR
jgi:hypothetical protein